MGRLLRRPAASTAYDDYPTGSPPFCFRYRVDNVMEFIKNPDYCSHQYNQHRNSDGNLPSQPPQPPLRSPSLSSQGPGESVDRYYAALKELDDAGDHNVEFTCSTCGISCLMECSTCNEVIPLSQHLQEIRIRDRHVCGLLDKEMQRKVLVEQYTSTFSLYDVLKICTAVEMSNAAGASLSHPSSELPEVAATGRKSTYKKQNSPEHPKKPQGNCNGCGMDRHPKEDCRAKTHQCEYCGKMGHFKKVCWKREKDLKAATPEPASDSSASNNTATTASTHVLLTVPTKIKGTTHFIQWLPDTGADIMAISLSDVKKLGAPALKAMTRVVENVIAANGSSLGPVGSIPSVTLSLNNKTFTTTLRVYRHVNTPLLSREACKQLGLIDSEWPLSQVTTNLNSISAGKIEVQPILPVKVVEQDPFKQTLLTEYLQAFNDAVLQPMKGPAMKIELIEGAIPCKRYKPHTIPYHCRTQVKEQLDTMIQKGVIEPVPVGEPVDWCHPMVVVPKKESSEPRITVDLTGLNKYVRRPAYPVRVPREVVASIPSGNRYFTTLDARHGYWQVALDAESRKLTSFITPWGSFRYCRNVMGLISAGDEHNRRGDEALQGISNVVKIVEDILIYDKDLDTHMKRVREVVERCSQHGITLNAKKLVLAKPEVDWCGFRITRNRYTPAPHLVAAISKFPVPTSKTDVRSFCGLVQQFEAFSHRITELALPIRSLLSSNVEFLWEATHQRAFEAVIKELISPRVLSHFQPGRPLRLETDAAQSKGLGYALWQHQHDGIWKLLQAGSRFVTPTESRYSASEVEMLAVCWAVKKCRLYLLGHPFELVVDHRPLISIINSKTLDEVDNPRLQRMKEKLSSYRTFAVWRAGTKHTVVDVFSRHPVSDPDDEDHQDVHDSDPLPFQLAALHDPDDGTSIITDPVLVGVQQAADLCNEYRRLRDVIMHGFPDKNKLDVDLHSYWKVKDDLSIENNLIFMGFRLLIPSTLRPPVLRSLHAAHQGQDRTLRRARQAVFWPGMTNDIRNVVKSCKECAAYLPSQQNEPLFTEPPAIYPFQTVGVDLFSFAGNEYMVAADRYSGWLHVAKLGRSASTTTVITVLLQWITDVGIPEKIISDNGPQFSSLEFKQWCQKLGITHSTSSPHYPQSNGLAEAGVKTIKHLLAKTSSNGDVHCQPFLLGLIDLRNMPRADGRSPAEFVFGAPTRTTVPMARRFLSKQWKNRAKECDERAARLRERALQRYNSNAKSLKSLAAGTIVLLYDFKLRQWTTLAEVIEQEKRGRSYLLKTESGRLLRRNRRFLRVFNPHDNGSTPTGTDPSGLRRSVRLQSQPRKIIGCAQRSHLKGGHVVVCPVLPHTEPLKTSGLTSPCERLRSNADFPYKAAVLKWNQDEADVQSRA